MNVIYSKDKNGLYNNKNNCLHVNALGTVYSDFGLHFFQATLKLFESDISLLVSCNISQICGPKNDKRSVPL